MIPSATFDATSRFNEQSMLRLFDLSVRAV